MYAETVMRERDKGGNIRNSNSVNGSIKYPLSSFQPIRDINKNRSSDEDVESLMPNRRRRKKMKDKWVSIVKEKGLHKETQTEENKGEREEGKSDKQVFM